MGKNKMGMILIIILLVVLLLLFAVGFVLLYNAMNSANQTSNPTANITVEEAVPIENIAIYSLGDSIVTNLLKGADQKDHVIKLSVNFGINNSEETAKEAEELKTKLEEQKSIIKDIINGVCRSKTYEELSVTDAKALLKEEILIKTQEAFATNLIVDVYIDEIFIQ